MISIIILSLSLCFDTINARDAGSGSIILKGSCPDYSKVAIKSVNVTGFGGMWYEYARFGYPVNAMCVTAHFFPRTGNSMYITYKGKRFVYKDWLTINGWLKFPDYELQGKVKFDYQMMGMTLMGWTPNPKYISAVDYENFFIIWSCYYVEETDYHLRYACIYTRRPLHNSEVDEQLKEKIEDAIGKVEPFAIKQLAFISHNESWFPEPPPPDSDEEQTEYPMDFEPTDEDFIRRFSPYL